MKKSRPFVFRRCEIVWTHSERDEVSHQSRRRNTRCNQHHAPDNKKFATLQSCAGFQLPEKDVDAENENQHKEYNSDRKMIPREVSAANVKIVIRCSKALAYHTEYANEHAPCCDTAISGMGSMWRVLRSGRWCHRRCVVGSIECR